MKNKINDIVITPIAFAVHRQRENPIYGEAAIRVILEDEAAGAFIVLESNEEDSKPGTIRIEFSELKAVAKAARVLQAHMKKLGHL